MATTPLTRRLGNAQREGAKRVNLWLRSDRRLERVLDRLTALRGETTRFSHRLVMPNATLSPWYDDREFMETYEGIRDHTHVDIYRCYELWTLLHQVRGLSGDVLEVGVWRGGTGALLARRSRLDGTPARTFLADTFSGVVKAGKEDPWYRGGEHEDTSTATVERLLDDLDETAHLLPGVFPDETGNTVEEARFRFVHIDVDVHDSAADVLEWAWPRLPVGGIVVFDDFGFFECEGVAALGARLTERIDVVRTVHNLNGHLVAVKIADHLGPLLGEHGRT